MCNNIQYARAKEKCQNNLPVMNYFLIPFPPYQCKCQSMKPQYVCMRKVFTENVVNVSDGEEYKSSISALDSAANMRINGKISHM